jgi:ribosomal protein S18 acetylase RimI-like enzyme
MASIEIRDARPEEYAEVAGVTVAGYEEYFPPEPWGPWIEYIESLGAVDRRATESEQIVAVGDGKIVGAVAFYPVGTEEGAQGRPPEWAGIRFLAVLPTARGRGIARKLTEECLRRARERGTKTIGLMTGSFMKTAQILYDRMGFARVPELDEQISDDIVGLQYRMDL